MEEAIEAGADALTGAVAARELDRLGGAAHRPDATGHDASGACANCGAALAGPFCARCGQHGHVHRTMAAFLHDVLHGVFHFEGRFWGTLPLLALRPGELTRRYVAGERAKFVSPMAMFLFSVFLMFAVVSKLPFLGTMDDLGGGSGQLRERVAEERGRLAADADAARRRLARRTASGDAEDAADARNELRTTQRQLAQVTEAERALPAVDRAGEDGTGDAGGWFRGNLDHARRNPELVAYKIKSSAYKYSWALIPLSLPFVWLLFPFRRDVGMYDHAVFATYSLSFMSLMVVALSLAALVPGLSGVAGLAGVVVPPFHIYRQLKGAYRLGRAGALWRTAWMLLFASIASALFVVGLTYLGTAH